MEINSSNATILPIHGIGAGRTLIGFIYAHNDGNISNSSGPIVRYVGEVAGGGGRGEEIDHSGIEVCFCLLPLFEKLDFSSLSPPSLPSFLPLLPLSSLTPPSPLFSHSLSSLTPSLLPLLSPLSLSSLTPSPSYKEVLISSGNTRVLLQCLELHIQM